MKVTKKYLQAIIAEELNTLLAEQVSIEQKAKMAFEHDAQVQNRIRKADIDDASREAVMTGLEMAFVEAFSKAYPGLVKKYAEHGPHDQRIDKEASVVGLQAMMTQLQSVETQVAQSQSGAAEGAPKSSGGDPYLARQKARLKQQASQVGPRGEKTFRQGKEVQP